MVEGLYYVLFIDVHREDVHCFFDNHREEGRNSGRTAETVVERKPCLMGKRGCQFSSGCRRYSRTLIAGQRNDMGR